MEKKIKEISPPLRQMILRKLGMYASSNLGSDTYYFIEAVSLLRKDIGEKVLQDHYGEEYEMVNKKLVHLSILVNRAKIDYDRLFKDPKNKQIRNDLLESLSKIPLFMDILYDVFNVLIKESSLQYAKIPSDAFKILERKGITKLGDKVREVPTDTSQENR